ncbi:MAG: GIY-YIG nuclease family protein [Balneolaceae bacterium]
MAMNYYFYILCSELKEVYYYGSSDDPPRRLEYHNHEQKGFTQRFRPWNIVFTQRLESRQKAEAAEKIVKGWKSKKMTRLLIEGKIKLEDYL